jgi:hypothetical protein
MQHMPCPSHCSWFLLEYYLVGATYPKSLHYVVFCTSLLHSPS